jgi:hypothetical protein
MMDDPMQQVRELCFAYPETTEKRSHGEPTFFVRKKVFVMGANNHHGDGRIAVWLPAPQGMQESLIATASETFFRPPYVGVRGWVGIELKHMPDADLAHYIDIAWRLIAPKKLQAVYDAG